MRSMPDSQTAIQMLQKSLALQPAALRRLGLTALRPGQDRAIYSLYSEKDTLCFLPTSAGKSLVYILPGLVNQWPVVIFSPLISLMKDQCEQLQQMRLKAAIVNSAQPSVENRYNLQAWEAGELQYLFVSPERQEQSEFMGAMRRRPPTLLAIDEAHVASEWSHNFRPSYARLGPFIDEISPRVVLCITATATEDVEEDLRRIFHLEHANRICLYPPRDNISFCSDNYAAGEGLRQAAVRARGATIIYCATRDNCEEVTRSMARWRPDVGAATYHAGLPSAERDLVQNRFMNDELSIIAATNSFGMGINKANIRAVIHRDIPGSVEAYVQEFGRSGRDGLPSLCTLLWDDDSFRTQEFFLLSSYPPVNLIRRVYHLLMQIKDPRDELRMTVSDLATNLGERGYQTVDACLKFLISEGVILRSERGGEPHRVKIYDMVTEPKLREFQDAIVEVGVKMPDGFLEVLAPNLAARLGWTNDKVNRNFNALTKSRLVAVQAPFRGAVTKVIGDLSRVDFERFEQKGRRAWRRLESIKEFWGIPDEEKHSYLSEYFSRKAEAEVV